MKFLMYADAHFRSTVPEARLDDYLKNQENIIHWLQSEFSEHTHLFAGDLLHMARERADQIEFALNLVRLLKNKIYGVYGNHDLLYHSTDNINKTTLGVLHTFGIFEPVPKDGLFLEDEDGTPINIYGFHYGTEMEPPKDNNKKAVRIALYHGMVLQEPHPHINGVLAKDLLTSFPQYDIILTGDNHKGFVVTDGDRIVINPGSLKRDNADQKDHKPHVYEYDSLTKKIRAIPVPIENDILSEEHIVMEKERDLRIEALSSKFQEVRNITLDYRDNMLEFLKQNNVNAVIEEKLLEWMM
jgi:predicted phosphodiesterase